MYYPNHHIRTYCLYLGSIELDEVKLDLGVYEHEDTVSHAIVFGTEPHQYMSGEFIFQGKPCPCFTSLQYQINKLAYEAYLMGKER